MEEELRRIANTVRTTPKGNGPLVDVGGENFERAISVCAEALEKIFEKCANVPRTARSTRPQSIVVSTSSLSTAAASSRSRTRRVPAPVPAGS
jgi:hypothetical protein